MINKRLYLELSRLNDESHPSVSAIAPLMCFFIVLTLGLLFRLMTIFSGAFATCVGTDEFWYSATGGNWPLVSTLVLLFVLLLLWNFFIAVDDWRKSTGTRIMVVVNSIGIVAMLAVFSALHDSASVSHSRQVGLFDNLEHRLYHGSTNAEVECAANRDLEGRWRVVYRKLGYYGRDFPATWVQLNTWGYAFTQDAEWAPVRAERWFPPRSKRYFEEEVVFPGELFDAPWEFELDGNTLVLETPEDWIDHEWQRSRIVLVREEIPPDSVVNLNPYSVLVD